MKFREPKDSDSIAWTEHVKEKMRFYGLSESRLKSLIRNPQRKEKGIAQKTVAIMQPAKSNRKKSEIWLMYQTVKLRGLKRAWAGIKEQNLKDNCKLIIISAWRYPGASPIGEPPIPQDTMEYLKKYGG